MSQDLLETVAAQERLALVVRGWSRVAACNQGP